jgi:sec-independent protein translocase protein TatA
MGRFGSQEILLLFLIVLLLFGAARLPKLARSMREARDEFQRGSDEDAASTAVPEARTENPEPAPTKADAEAQQEAPERPGA